MFSRFAVEYPETLDLAQATKALATAGKGLFFEFMDQDNPACTRYIAAYGMFEAQLGKVRWYFERYTVERKLNNIAITLSSAEEMAAFCAGYLTIEQWAVMQSIDEVQVWPQPVTDTKELLNVIGRYDAMVDAVPQYVHECVEHIDVDFSWEDFRTWYAEYEQRPENQP